MIPMRFSLATAVVMLVAAPAVMAAGSKPKLTAVQRVPFVVAGADFVPGERVSVTALTGYGPRQARVVARGGRFRVEFRVPSQGCGTAWAVRAVGSRGSRALLQVGEPSPCVPPPSR